MIQIYYFTGCCGNITSFGITSGSTSSWNGFNDTVGNSYGLILRSFSGCVTYSGVTIEPIPNLPIYNGFTPLFLSYDCQFCIENIFPCYSPKPEIPSVVVGTKNECGIITILPMEVECVVSNPSSYEIKDGEVSVSITGGTPPYTTTWTNYGISPALNGLGGNESYTATTVDYYGDYTAVTVCSLYVEKDCSFSASIVEYMEQCFDNGMSGYTFDIT